MSNTKENIIQTIHEDCKLWEQLNNSEKNCGMAHLMK